MGDCRLCLQYQSWLSILCAVQLIQTMAPKGFLATLTPPQLLRDHRGHRRCCANDCNASCYEYEVTQANLSFQAARSLMGAHCCHNCWIHQNLPDYATWAGLPYHNEYCEQDMLGPKIVSKNALAAKGAEADAPNTTSAPKVSVGDRNSV